MEASKEYISIINGLIKATNEGKLTWKRENPSTFFCQKKTSRGETAIISIQYIGPSMRNYFIFNVKNASINEIVLNIDTMLNREFVEILQKLYRIVESSVDKRAIDFLQDLFQK